MLARFATPANGSFHHYKPRSTPGAHDPSRTPRIDRLALTSPRIYQVHDLAHSAKRVVKRAAIEAKNSLKYSADESPFLSFEQQQAAVRNLREVRVPNEFMKLNLTLMNNAYGDGVVVSALGTGVALQAGLMVGDVIACVNGATVISHEVAMQRIKEQSGPYIVLTLVGTPRKVVLDKSRGDLQITLTNRENGLGVDVSGVGYSGVAYESGVGPGDVILSINGNIATDHPQAIMLIDSSERYIELVLGQRPPEFGRGGLQGHGPLVGI